MEVIGRPHPLGPALHTTLELHVSATSTLEDIQGQLCLRWLDLVPGQADWAVEPVDSHVLQSLEFEDGTDLEIFVVVVDQDLPDDHEFVVMVDAQLWQLEREELLSDLQPLIVSASGRCGGLDWI